MEVYFVRHGQTDANVARRHQVGKTPLTKLGRKQAVEVAKKAKTWNPTHLVTSSHVRALETARVIGDELEMIPETSELFTELHRPDSLHGYRHLSPISVRYIFTWFFEKKNTELSDKGAESYEEIRQRIQKAREYLESLPEDSKVVVVSHSIFINLFVTHVCRPERMSMFRAATDWTRIKSLKNTGVRKFIYSKGEGKCGWTLTNS